MSIKELIADVTAITTDIGDCAITTAKIANAAGRIYAASIPALTAAATNVHTFTCTAAVTIYDAVIIITAVDTSGTWTLQSTASVVCIAAFGSTTAQTVYATAVVTLPAGASLGVSLTASGTSDAAGKIILSYVAAV